jgi:hypothetical protein
VSESLPPAASEPLSPRPLHFPEDISSDAELHEGPSDGPDVLSGIEEDEPDLESLDLRHDLPIHRPEVDHRLTESELQSDLNGE